MTARYEYKIIVCQLIQFSIVIIIQQKYSISVLSIIIERYGSCTKTPRVMVTTAYRLYRVKCM